MRGDSVDREFALATVRNLWPGAEVGDAPGRQPTGDRRQGSLLVLPSSRRVRVLAPTSPRRAAAAGLARNSSPVSRRQRVVRFAGRLALLSGIGPLVPSKVHMRQGHPPRPSILDHLGDVLGEPVTVVIALGTQRANRKPVLRVMDRRGRTLAFAKVGINEPTKALVQGEASALERLSDVDWATFAAPRVIDFSDFGGCDVLTMTTLPSSGAKGLADASARRALLRELAGGFGVQRDPIQGGEYLTRLTQQLNRTTEHELVTRLAESVSLIQSVAGGEEFQLGAWHGDFTPWNLVTSQGKSRVWDWERFDPRVPQGMDELHFCMNSFVQGKAFTVPHVLTGLQLSTWPYGSPHAARLHQATYLAALATRYVSSFSAEGGLVTLPKATVLVEALHRVLGPPARSAS